jgi:hypothetical protein
MLSAGAGAAIEAMQISQIPKLFFLSFQPHWPLAFPVSVVSTESADIHQPRVPDSVQFFYGMQYGDALSHYYVAGQGKAVAFPRAKPISLGHQIRRWGNRAGAGYSCAFLPR